MKPYTPDLGAALKAANATIQRLSLENQQLREHSEELAKALAIMGITA